ncbi:MAG TPA: tetratricopeptide repeat protein [Thermoplasmata archaeon]|nr:tetratricopeptide repeat protein [Thermoplasmata archaeon]
MSGEARQQAENHLAEGDYERAVKAFRKAIREDPEDAEAHFGLAEAASALADSPVTEIAGCTGRPSIWTRGTSSTARVTPISAWRTGSSGRRRSSI